MSSRLCHQEIKQCVPERMDSDTERTPRSYHYRALTKLIPISCSIAHHSPALFDSLKKSGSPDLSSIGRGGGGEGGYPMSLGTSFREEMSWSACMDDSFLANSFDKNRGSLNPSGKRQSMNFNLFTYHLKYRSMFLYSPDILFKLLLIRVKIKSALSRQRKSTKLFCPFFPFRLIYFWLLPFVVWGCPNTTLYQTIT
jgi:hypothetical protein